MTVVSEPRLARDPLAGAVSRPKAGRIGHAIAALAVFAAPAALADWDAPEFGRHPDEAAHLITGTLVHDWAADGFPGSPVAYALRYYARYPKVAVGHWPPGFYLLQGAWYGLFGVSRASAVALASGLAGGFLLLLFECLRRRVSGPAAVLTLGLVVASPVFRYVSSEFLAETLVAGLSLSAVWCYAAFLDSGRLAPALGFGALSAAAVLTKQDAIALAAVPPLSVVFLRRWRLLTDWRFYAPAAVVVAACLPYYLVMLEPVRSAWSGLERKPVLDKAAFLAGGLCLTGWASAALAAAGAFAARRSSCFTASLAAQALGVAAVQTATPVSFDPRYKAALLPTAALLAAHAFRSLTARGRVGLAALAVLAGVLAVDRPAPMNRKVTGYGAAVSSLEGRRGLQVVLVCSDPMGDGAVAAEFRLRHPRDRFCVLRADKMLARSTWMNRHYRLTYDSPRQVEDYLTRQPVHYVLIDDWGRDSGAHHGLLQALLDDHPERFPPLAAFPVVRRSGGVERRGTARLYRVAATADLHPDAVDLQIPGLPRDGRIRLTADDF